MSNFLVVKDLNQEQRAILTALINDPVVTDVEIVVGDEGSYSGIGFHTNQPNGNDEDGNEIEDGYDNSLSSHTIALIQALGYTDMWNDCPGCFNEGIVHKK